MELVESSSCAGGNIRVLLSRWCAGSFGNGTVIHSSLAGEKISQSKDVRFMDFFRGSCLELCGSCVGENIEKNGLFVHCAAGTKRAMI